MIEVAYIQFREGSRTILNVYRINLRWSHNGKELRAALKLGCGPISAEKVQQVSSRANKAWANAWMSPGQENPLGHLAHGTRARPVFTARSAVFFDHPF